MKYQFIKYPNRKIYSLQLKSYVKLTDLINYNAPLVVVDSATKADITEKTLAAAHYEAYRVGIINLDVLSVSLELLAHKVVPNVA